MESSTNSESGIANRESGPGPNSERVRLLPSPPAPLRKGRGESYQYPLRPSRKGRGESYQLSGWKPRTPGSPPTAGTPPSPPARARSEASGAWR